MGCQAGTLRTWPFPAAAVVPVIRGAWRIHGCDGVTQPVQESQTTFHHILFRGALSGVHETVARAHRLLSVTGGPKGVGRGVGTALSQNWGPGASCCASLSSRPSCHSFRLLLLECFSFFVIPPFVLPLVSLCVTYSDPT